MKYNVIEPTLVEQGCGKSSSGQLHKVGLIT